MSESLLTPLIKNVNLESIKDSGVRAVVSNSYLSKRDDKLSVYVNLTAFSYLKDENTKRIVAGLVRKQVGEDLPVFFAGKKQALMSVVSQAQTDLSQITRMSIQTSRLEWDFEGGIRILVDKDMINFVSQKHVKNELIEALRTIVGPDMSIKFNF